MNKSRSRNRHNFPRESGAPDRLLRVAELIRRELLILLRTKAGDPRLRHATIARVHVLPDWSVARVYIALEDDQQDPRELLDGLRHAAGFLRSALSKRLNLRKTPKLFFARLKDRRDERYFRV